MVLNRLALIRLVPLMNKEEFKESWPNKRDGSREESDDRVTKQKKVQFSFRPIHGRGCGYSAFEPVPRYLEQRAHVLVYSKNELGGQVACSRGKFSS